MKRIAAALVLTIAMATNSIACNTCPQCTDGKDGIDGKDGLSIKGDPGDVGPKGDKGDPGTLSAIYRADKKTTVSTSGALAMTRIDHAKNGGMALGVGISAIDDAEAIAIGVSKSLKSEGEIKEYVFDVSAFVGASGATEASGVAAALTAHF